MHSVSTFHKITTYLRAHLFVEPPITVAMTLDATWMRRNAVAAAVEAVASAVPSTGNRTYHSLTHLYMRACVREDSKKSERGGKRQFNHNRRRRCRRWGIHVCSSARVLRKTTTDGAREQQLNQEEFIRSFARGFEPGCGFDGFFFYVHCTLLLLLINFSFAVRLLKFCSSHARVSTTKSFRSAVVVPLLPAAAATVLVVGLAGSIRSIERVFRNTP